ncbi:hypothetical protein Pmani_019588 [Petrolisthes manimaculis]|uniref:Ionotropic glutamate receptor L-glutamate and glycine-binding domain-containing protein n=1 Tax=Petrolisthes manimaculis TaxID=1843537 RepID=A0AAE1PJA2_9EUCA|nr:hypothetical protein Pmani_019588 [Petrolisthes manimaculis]
MTAVVKTLLLHWFFVLWPQPTAEKNCVDVRSDVVGQGEVGETVGETVSETVSETVLHSIDDGRQQRVEGDVDNIVGKVKGELEGQQRVEGDVGEVAGIVKGGVGEMEGQGIRGDVSNLEGQRVVVVQHGVNERQGSEAEKQGVHRSKIKVVLDGGVAEQQILGQVISEIVEQQQHLSRCDLVLLDSSHRSKLVLAFTSVVELKVYRRSLYMRNGEAGVQHVLTTNLSSININSINKQHILLNSTLFFSDNDPFLNFEGHKLRVVTTMYFPYVAYRKEGEGPGTPVVFTDSLDGRLYQTLSPALNFTYEVHEEPNRTWGTETNGVFSGMMGQLQREECDLCTMTALNPSRQANFHLAEAYPADGLVLISRKPDLLPPYLSLVRPFSGEVWVSLLMGVALFGVSFWALLRVLRLCIVGGREVTFVTALLYSWGALLERSPPHPTSVSFTGRMMMACWLIVGLIVTSAFRSSLVAHLTVQGREAPLDTLEDLVTRPSWGWGMESWTLTGTVKELITENRDPVFSQTFREMETGTWKEFLEKVVRGRFSLLTVRNHITVIVASYYTDHQGQTPVYISPTSVFTFPSFGWIFRKGAPFYKRFQTILTSLVESGIMQVWKEDVIAKRVKETKDSDTFKLYISQETTMQDNTRVVLGLHHLQGAFYLLFLGCGLAFLTLLGEKLESHI